jgi:hypothetical protein
MRILNAVIYYNIWLPKKPRVEYYVVPQTQLMQGKKYISRKKLRIMQVDANDDADKGDSLMLKNVEQGQAQ